MSARASDALRDAAADDDVAVIVLTGSGRAFCAGVDIEYLEAMAAGTADSAPTVQFNEELQLAEKPIIAAVNGLAVGVGTTMCLHVDLVVAGESARFRTPFTKIGVAPEIGSSWLLPQQLGYQKAAWMLLSSEWVDAAQALDWGLVLEVVPDEELVTWAIAVGQTIAANNTASIRAVKRTLRAWRQGPIDAAIEAENAEFRALMVAPGFAPGRAHAEDFDG
jgi:enoyl-CoA hydratase/carnithine racemase